MLSQILWKSEAVTTEIHALVWFWAHPFAHLEIAFDCLHIFERMKPGISNSVQV